MDFLKALTFSATFVILLVGSYCLDIKIQESYGDKDDGLVNKGSTFSIYCSVPEIRAGQVAVWYKQQGESLPIVLGFNDFLLDPTSKEKFVGKSIYAGADEGEPEDQGELVAYILNLKEGLGADYADSGAYGCAISGNIPDEGSDHTQQEIVYSSLVVLDPVDSIHLYSVKKEEISDPLKYYKEYEDGEDVRIDPGDEFYFRCVAVASNPPATVRIYLGDKDLTEQYKQEVTEDYVEAGDTDAPAGHHLAYDVTLTSEYPVRIDREDNKRPFSCNATVPHQASVGLAILPTMLYYPEIECQDSIAEYEEKRATLRCIVRATPKLTHARFVYNETTWSGHVNHTITVGESAGSMSMRVDSGEYEDQYIYSLVFEHVPEQSFRKYVFQGGNKIANVTASARLILENPGAVMGSGVDILQAMSLLTLLAISALNLRL